MDPLTISVASYTAVLTDVTTALGSAVPAVAAAAAAVGAGLIVLRIGFRVVKRFAGG